MPEWGVWLDVPTAPDGYPVRHRVFRGGRGGAKSWTIAHKLVERAYLSRERILCAREYQISLADSSKKLLEDTIERLGLGPSGSRFFQFREREIIGINGSEFVFIGLNGREASIKSLEGFTLAWIEEAASVSKSSIDTLIPTIRARGSEIWWTYNPRYPTDAVDEMFRGDNRPPGSIVIEVHWYDNPWFPDVLKQDMAYDQARDDDKYQHIWLGQYLRHSEARVFKNYTVMPFEAPDNAVLHAGADWGFSIDPTVLVRCFRGEWAGEPGQSVLIAKPNGKCLFIDHEAYKVGCPTHFIPALFAGHDRHHPQPLWENPHGYPGIPGATRFGITADSARPEIIDEIRKKGFNIKAAVKGKNSVEEGISFLQSHDIYVHPRCVHTIAELTHYSWKIDKPTGAILSEFADKDNHVIDALRYALEGVRKATPGGFAFMSARRVWPQIGDYGSTYMGPKWGRIGFFD